MLRPEDIKVFDQRDMEDILSSRLGISKDAPMRIEMLPSKSMDGT